MRLQEKETKKKSMRVRSFIAHDDRMRKYDFKDHDNVMFITRFHRVILWIPAVFVILSGIAVFVLPFKAVVKYPRIHTMDPWGYHQARHVSDSLRLSNSFICLGFYVLAHKSNRKSQGLLSFAV